MISVQPTVHSDFVEERTITLSRGLTGARFPPKLTVLSGSCQGLERALKGRLIVGTDPTCDLVLRDRGVSRRHAEFWVDHGQIHVRDLGSRNGTFSHGTRLREAEVTLGSVVELADTTIGVYPRWQIREVPPSNARGFELLHGHSLAMREIFAVLERVARTDVTVLIEGESGTGKELAAHSLHRASARADGPFVVFDCSAVAKELAESELFGHKRGAFSGAVDERRGAFQQAHTGTIFLDELGELPLDLQPRLLRALESGEVRPVGDDRYRQVDVRVVAATNRDLSAEARHGRFRQDLLYRLQVVSVRLPPLRQRPDDIPLLIAKLLTDKLRAGDTLGGENLERLLHYSWPGNVRELRNVLQRACALTKPDQDGRIAFDDLVFNVPAMRDAPALLGYAFPGVDQPMPYKEAKAQLLEQFDAEYVSALVRRHRGNVTRAAQAAGLSRKHLYELQRRVTGVE